MLALNSTATDKNVQLAAHWTAEKDPSAGVLYGVMHFYVYDVYRSSLITASLLTRPLTP
jgi:hypothetical protein